MIRVDGPGDHHGFLPTIQVDNPLLFLGQPGDPQTPAGLTVNSPRINRCWKVSFRTGLPNVADRTRIRVLSRNEFKFLDLDFG